MTASSPERAFAVFRRGQLRDEGMASFRHGLRTYINPDTGVAFTETEIAIATARESRFYIDADSTDLILLAVQSRDSYLADQVRPDRAAHAWLLNYHGTLWNLPVLGASGASGPVNAPAAVGTVFVGSTTVPDPVAHQCTSPAGLRFQNLFTTITPAGGVAALTLQGIDTGPETNLDVGVELTWSNGPPGAPEKAAVTTKLSGGLAAETDAQYGRRVLDTMRRKEGAGNNAQLRAWARQATVAVEDAFIYACAKHGGSVRIVVTQKRGDTLGPTARIASIGTLADVTSYMTPPGSPVLPTPPLVLVTAADGEACDMVMGMSMPTGQASGYVDIDPWPTLGGATPQTQITAVTSQLIFQITRGTGIAVPPVTAPSLMLWDDDTSRFESLSVTSITAAGGDLFNVVLSSAAITPLVAQYISPDSARRLTIAKAVDTYFDHLGPGELIDLTSDDRSHRAYRYPRTNEESPLRAGSGIESWLRDGLGAALADFTLDDISIATPTLPTDPVDEPNLLVAGDIGIYPF